MALISVGPSSGALVPITPDPYSLKWSLMDVSASDAGRSMSANAPMYKDRIAQKRKLELAWRAIGHADAGRILRAFDPEYVWVSYWDAKDDQWEVREFYVGDRDAPVKLFWASTGALFETISFDIIER
jgi:hypothetical protein